MKKGLFIVIDGADGAGKATQAKKLIERLKKNEVPTVYVDFPRYETFFGKTIARFLRGEFGDLKTVSPYLASIPYALDRQGTRTLIESALNSGKYVIANRFVSSNMAHQAAKIANKKDRSKYLDWVSKLEYQVLGVPKENIVVYLKMSEPIASRLVDKKGQRQYLRGKVKDIHEEDSLYQRSVADLYLKLAKKHRWIVIKCYDKGEPLSINVIHDKIVKKLQLLSMMPKNLR